jgi:hypothetical protein
MSLAYSSMFAASIIAGYLLTVVGAVLSLAAGVWWMLAGEWAHGETRPPAFRALAAVAFLLFIVGLFWQLIGYLRLSYSLTTA